MRLFRFAPVALGFGILACGPAKSTTTTTPPGNRVSEFGRYEGYSDSLYSEWVRTSEYVTVRDGVKLAVDIIRPAVNGVAVDKKLPVVWTHSRYHRTSLAGAGARTMTASHDLSAVRQGAHPKVKTSDFTTPDSTGKIPFADAPSIVDRDRALQRLIKHGYVIVSVQVRGGGSSFGRYEGLFSPNETQDAYDVMEWLTKQPWCDGNLGMEGGSYLGITQYMAASTRHPALKAIFPTVAAFTMYDMVYPGGVYRENMTHHWGVSTRNLDLDFPEPPVQGDSTGKLRAQALAQHANTWNLIDEYRAAPFRDHDSPSFAYSRFEPAMRLAAMNQSGVAAYHWGGWYDIFAKDEMLWLTNWTGPDRVTMGPWSHAFPDSLIGAEQARLVGPEQHRWFDRWLKGIKNGIDTEPPVRYALLNDPGSWTWKTADQWPPKGVETVAYYFAAGPSGSVASVNDGLLATEKPAAAGQDKWTVDLTTTTGPASRWNNAVGQGRMIYPDLAPNDAKAATYTTPVLTADLAIVGHPVLRLYVTSDQPDGDFQAILSEVDDKGFSRYVTEGMLRASHRDTTTAPWNNLGLPWHRGYAADKKPMVPGQVAELDFDLLPTATVFNAGHRLRLTITGADTDNTEKPPVRGRPTIQIYRGADHASEIMLPVMR
ncbi:MAG: CocE/NonD family hydrolase [Gemmatimonadota bacterium]